MTDPPVIARNRQRGTGYVSVAPGNNPEMSWVTTVSGSKYIVRTASIEHIDPTKDEPMPTCSKCKEPPKRAIVVYEGEPPPMGQKDLRNARIIRFCQNHWREIEPLIPVAA